MTLTAAVLALVIGGAMGLLGGGGSIVAIPAFTFLLHQSPKEAVVTSLAVVGLAAAAGATGHLFRGVVPIRTAATVGAAAMAGAYAGGAIGAQLSDRWHLVLLGPVMLGAGVLLLWLPGHLHTVRTTRSNAVLALIGVAVGTFTGLVGVGGGFLMVPALVLFAGLDMHEAAAVSLAVIAVSALSGLLAYLGHASLAWPFIGGLAAIASAGTLAGSMAARRLPQQHLQRAFAMSLMVMGALVLTRL